MRSAFLNMALIGLLVSLLAFATSPAAARTSLNQPNQKAATTIEHKGPVANACESGRATGGEATVARVNRYGKCLHVFRGPSVYSREIACMSNGEKTHLTGVFSKNKRWVQLSNGGWVLFRDLKTTVKPAQAVAIEKSWARSAAAGKGKLKTAQHHSRDQYWGTSWGPM